MENGLSSVSLSESAWPDFSAHLLMVNGGLLCFRPLWLSPSQVMVVPVGPTCDDYAEKVTADN